MATPVLRSSNLTEDTISEMWKETKLIPNPVSLLEEILNSSNDTGKRGAYAAKRIMDLYKEGRIEFTERWKERRKMYDTLDNLVAKSEGRFKNRVELFDEFARANFTGNYLPVARIVEDILGKGTFRKMAEEFSSK